MNNKLLQRIIFLKNEIIKIKVFCLYCKSDNLFKEELMDKVIPLYQKELKGLLRLV